MKMRKKTLHEFSPHIPPKTPKRSSSSTNEMLHTDIIVRTQRTRVSGTHGTEATTCHQNGFHFLCPCSFYDFHFRLGGLRCFFLLFVYLFSTDIL
jgi:hypothetical protein